MNKGMDLSGFTKSHETPKSRAFQHALDIELMVLDRMNELGISKKELAQRMGISKSNLSNMLNSQPNLTLETIAKFELALDSTIELSLQPNPTFQAEYQFEFADLQTATDEQREPVRPHAQAPTKQHVRSAQIDAVIIPLAVMNNSAFVDKDKQENVA